jgi:2-aminoadipate transaminase
MIVEERRFARRLQNMGGNVIREILKLTQQPDIISFAGGNPAVDTFPAEELSQIAQDILHQNRNILQYGTTEGYAPLREFVAGWVSNFGIKATPGEVLIMSGSQQGLDLLGKAFLDPGDKVVMESPTYLAAIQIFKTYEASFAVVHGDQHGVSVDELEEVIIREKPKIMYLVPTFQNPTGITLDLLRRRQIGQMMSKYEVVLIEDDPYAMLRYAGDTLPSIKSFDVSGQVVFYGSFSKLVSPGLRVGFAIAEPSILQKMVIGKQGTDVHTNNLAQAMVYEFCRRGMLEPHVQTTREKYSRKLRIMQEQLHLFPQDISWTSPQGGLFIWGTLPESVNATELLSAAIREKVAFVPGESFFAEGGHANTIRLNFSNASEDMIREGMQRLARVYSEFVK